MSTMDVPALATPFAGVGPSRRALDVAVSLLLLLVTAPILLVVTVLLAATRSGPVLYRQIRVGEGGRAFTMLKFRTMAAGRSGPEYTVPGDPRVTRLGGLLRAVHLDELPQLVNVVRGDMTLVGPRPETPSLASRYPPDCRQVLLYRPGITGPCQVEMEKIRIPEGADPEAFYLAVLVPRRVALDMGYLGAPTLRRTLGLLFATVWVVLRLRRPSSPRYRRSRSTQKGSTARQPTRDPQ
jgi:lipopolysaccharide/colanic/teichoic acid biosynthesis glycosyltransferase